MYSQAGCVGTYFIPALGARGRWISEVEASLVYRSKFQDSQGYVEEPA